MKDRQFIHATRFCVALVLAFITGTILSTAVATPAAAQSRTYSVLYSFSGGGDGGLPTATMTRDASGNWYGTTYYGGDVTCDAPHGCGTVFKMDPSGTLTTLHTFRIGEGWNPYAGVILDAAGNVYGTTIEGAGNLGLVFKLDSSGTYTQLHTFTGSDGDMPYGGLIRDSAGDLYGTTYLGGDLSCWPPYGCGVVFKLDRTGVLTVLHSFTGADGIGPIAGLTRDASGTFYGTTFRGGDLTCSAPNGCGTVFKLDPTGALTVLHSFNGGSDGVYPAGGVIRDAAGNLYGTAEMDSPESGGGTVFRVDPAGGFTVLGTFTGYEGAAPTAILIQDPQGVLYGTTSQAGPWNGGTLFKLDPATRRFKFLHNFAGGTDGVSPYGGLISDGAGYLVGTTEDGGAYGGGTIFKITTH